MSGPSILTLIGLLALVFAVPAISSARARPGPWYDQQLKPKGTPPPWLFGPVWTFLYVSMAFAAWVVWRRVGWPAAAHPMALFLIQLFFNGAWTWIFFGLHRRGLALIDIAVLWIAIVATMLAFWQVSPAAGALLIPYLAWVTYATYLSGASWWLNE